jgi:DNA excision repair protein ERCC-4
MSSRADDRVRITADDRERAAGVIEALDAMEDVELSIGRLSLGDYVVENGLLVERKTVLDLGLSILDGRLFRQVGRLARAPAMRPCLIVEGAVTDFDRAAVPRCALQGAILTVMLLYGLPILYSSDPGETARLLRIAARQLRRREARGPERFCSKTGSDRRLRMLMLQAVPDIGPVRAEALVDAFGTIEAIAGASVRDLATTAGIGPVIAKRLLRIVCGGEA